MHLRYVWVCVISFSIFMISRKAFTLIELLVVIAIIAILAVVVVLTLNPAELLRQSRDANRVSDMSTLTDALGIYTEQSGGAMGSSSVVYISIPDPIATSSLGDQCQGLGLSSLGGDTYHCAASSTFRNTDGTGWIPVDFQNISIGTPLSSLPVDPTNTTSTGLYYTYMTNGTTGYQITYGTESQKYSQLCAAQNGQYSDLCETGTSIGIAPIDFYSAGQPGKIFFNTPKNFAVATNTILYLGFNDVASTSVNFALSNLTGASCPTGGILKPDGTTLASQVICGSAGSLNNITLPITGNYKVFLNPGGGSASGTITLTTSLVGNLSFNTPISMTSTYDGQYVSYTFSGTASTSVSLALSNMTWTSCPTGGILNPNGTTLTSQLTCGSAESFNNITLPTTGTYTAFINPGAGPISATFYLSTP